MAEIVRYQFEGGVDLETWKKFRIGCVNRGITIKERLCELIIRAVQQQESKHGKED